MPALALTDHGALYGAIDFYTLCRDAGIKPIIGVPLVVTNDIHYVHADDAEAQDAMVCIQSGKTIDTPDRLKMIDNPELFMRTAAQMSELFPSDPEALENTMRIADKVDVKLPLGELRLPHFEVPAGKTPEEQLRTLGEAGLVG